jgi:TolA-binding protein
LTDFATYPQLSLVVYDIAESYRNTSKFEQSLAVYKDVVTVWPKSSQAMMAQRGVAISYVALKKLPEAQVELDKLTNLYSKEPNIALAVFNVADAYYWFKNYAEADSVYKYVVSTYPKSDATMWAQMGLAISSVAQNKDADAEAATLKLVKDFADNSKLPQALSYIEGRYEYAKNYEKAKALYQIIAQQFPTSTQAVNTPFVLAKIDVLSGIEAGNLEVLIGIDGLIAKFSDRTDLLPTLTGVVAEGLYAKGLKMKSDADGSRKAYLQKAVDLWEQAAVKSPNLVYTADGYNWAGHCYRNIGEFQKAIDCYSNVVEKFPKFARAWNAQFLIGQCYEQMKNSGIIDEAQANLKTKEAYQKLISNYPDCKAITAAKSWLERKIQSN